MNRKHTWLALVVVTSLLLTGCFGRKKRRQPDLGATAEPDKVLYERALKDISSGRHTIGRLTLQTLINTYPDSEYLAKAKLAIGDSYFKEGGRAGLMQSIAEYKDFGTFFPFLDEAAYAQFQVGMAHFRQLEKPDRDRTEARLAEDEFQVFLQKFANHPLAPQAEQRLREVQEILAEGDFRIARFYYIKGSLRAAGARLMEMTNRYPLYSQADRALWMLGTVFERAEKSDIAASYYTRIVRDYPLSDLIGDAKNKLTKLGVPVPQPDPAALARMQREREMERNRPGMIRRPLGILRSGPDVSMAARVGQPTLTPASETSTETLTPGGKMSVGTTGGGTSGNTAVVETVSAGSSPGAPSSGTTPAAGSASSGSTPPAPSPGTETPSTGNATAPEAKSSADPASPSDKSGKNDTDKKKESSSKKKKGLRKVIPW